MSYVSPQARAIGAHLHSGNSITALEALGVFRCFRLSARIQELRDDGHDIVTEYRRDAHGKQYARYWMRLYFPAAVVSKVDPRSGAYRSVAA